MKANLPSERQVIQEALQILASHMQPVKLARFIAACNLGEGNYLSSKDRLFEGETVDSLYAKIHDAETAKQE
jgi:hypothetical protein